MQYSILEIVKCIFPFWGFALWFVVAWLWLILLSPFLQKILNWERENLKKLIIVLTFLVPILSTLYIGASKKHEVLVYFVYMYLCIGYYKKYLDEKIKIKPNIFLTISFMLYIILICINFYGYEYNVSFLMKMAHSYLGDFRTIPNLIIAVPIFYYFKNLNLGKNKIINTIAKPTLAVYIIHQTPGFIHYLWYNVFKSEYFLQQSYALLYIIAIPMILYIAAMVTEYARQNLSRILNNSAFQRGGGYIESIIDNFYRDI